MSPREQAALEEIDRRKAEGAEVVCVIRSRTDPKAQSEIIVLDRVTPAFLDRLGAAANGAPGANAPARPTNWDSAMAGVQEGSPARGAAPRTLLEYNAPAARAW